MKTFAFRAILAAGLLFLVHTARADSVVKVGSVAPPLTLREVMQAPAGIQGTWEELKGQAVVLEFWATWCGGCVDNIPHLNELAEQFDARPIKFISITDETDVALVKQFLSRHPVNGWIAFDADEITFKRYGVEGRPLTILVDTNGVIRAITNPPSVTPQVLEDLLSGKMLDFPEVRMGKPFGFEANAPTPLLQMLIRPAASVEVSGYSPGGVNEKAGRYDVYGETPLDILSDAYQIPVERIDAPEWCGKARYDFSVVTPQHDEAQRWPLVKQMLQAAFALKVHREMKETQVFALRTVEGLQPKLASANSSGKGGYWNHVKGEIEVVGASIQKVTAVAHFVLGVEVFDETGLNGRYDFALKWDPKQPSSITVAIRDQLGLQLVPEQKKLEHLVVDSVEEKRTW